MAALEKLAQLAGVALFVLPGAALVQLLPALRSLPRGRRLAHAYVLGVAWLAGSLYALSHVFAVPLRRPAILALAAVPILTWLAVTARRGRGSAWPRGATGSAEGAHTQERGEGKLSHDPRRRWMGLQLAAFAVAALVFLAVLADALTYPVRDWDGRMTWATQARYIRAEGTVDPSVLRQSGWYVTHPWYPVLMPVAQAAVLELLRAGDDEPFFRGFYAFFFPAWLLILYGGARRWTRPSAAALITLAAALLAVPSTYADGGAVSAYSDLPLACFYGAGFLLLLKPRPRLSAAAAAGLLLAAAALTKNEGGPLALWAVAVAFLIPYGSGVRRRRLSRRWQPFALAAGLVAAALILLLAWRSGIPDRFRSYERIISWSHFWPAVVQRMPLLLPRIWHELMDWDLFWSAALLVLLAGWRGLRRRAAPALLLAAAGPLGIAWIAYSISVDPVNLVRTSWYRFLLQASIPLLVLVALALDDLLRRARWLPPVLGGPARSLSRRPRRPAENPASDEPSIAAPDPPRATG
jgi:hypothetical protein